MLQISLSLCASLAFCPNPKMGCVFSYPVVMISLIWAIALCICVCSITCYLNKSNKIKKEMAEDKLEHEETMKENAYEQEKAWAKFNELSASTDESLKKRIEEMEQSIASLNRQLEHEKGKNDLNKKLLSSYEECFKQLKVQIVADKKEPAADNKEPAADNKEKAVDKKDSTAANEEKVADNKEQ